MSNYICIKNCDAAARLTILRMYMDSGSVLRRNTLIKEIDSVAAITKSPLPHIPALATVLSAACPVIYFIVSLMRNA